ncbi:MAG: hypothetical protein JWP27_2309 [Flaviaesturariibacter sp.]|nr:hypothetical protein [Flaviaesturariibacter sp.]
MTLVLAAAGLFFSCKKRKADSEPTRTDLLVQQAWTYESSGLDFDRNGTVDAPLPIPIPACSLDNTYVFNTNGSGVINEGATKCDVSAPQTSPFSWSFGPGQTSINLQSTALFGLGGQFKVNELTAARFILSKDTTISTVTFGIIINLKH